jgi:hypothetical protein
LYDIYLAVEPELPFEMPARSPDACCRFAPFLPQALTATLEHAKLALQQHLSAVTLDQVLGSMDRWVSGACLTGPLAPVDIDTESPHTSSLGTS